MHRAWRPPESEPGTPVRQIRVFPAQLSQVHLRPSDVKAKTPSTAQLASGKDCPYKPLLHTCAAQEDEWSDK